MAVVVVHRRRGLVAFATLRTGEREALDLLVAVLLFAPLVNLASGNSTTATARFVFLLYPVVLVLVAAIPLPQQLRRAPVPSLLAGVALVGLLGHTWLGARWFIARDDGGHEVLTGQVVTDDGAEVLAAWLRDAGVRTAYADYWLAYPVDWFADGDVSVEPLYERRFPSISAAVLADPSPALIVSGDEVGAVRRALAERGVGYQEQLVAGWWVFTNVSPGVHLEPAATVADALAAS